MSDNKTSDASHPAMDMDAHRGTFDGFVEVSKTGTVLCINTLITLAYVYIDYPVVAVVFLIAMLVTATIGLMMKSNGWVPGAALLVLGLLGLVVA